MSTKTGTTAGAAGPAGARERRVRTGGVDLCVVEMGDPDRPTVVLVHGYPDSKEVWSDVAERLAARFHVVLYDVRGHGHSTAPEPLRGGFTLEKLTDDFLAVADAVSPDRPVHLVGHDWGSVQGWEFATTDRTEGRIASFTSMSGPSLDHLGHWIKKRTARPTPRAVAQLLGQGAKSWYVYVLHTPRLPELAWRGPLGKRWPDMLRRDEQIPDGPHPAASLASDAANGAWLYRDNVRPRMRRPRPDAYAHVPVQLIVATGDVFLSERLYDDLEHWAPDLVRRTLPAKHWLPRTRPDQVSAWITEFVTAREEPALRTPEQRPPAKYADRFGGQLVLVTGAASGIGRATAFAFAEAGARVVAVDRDAEGAERTADMARLVGPRGLGGVRGRRRRAGDGEARGEGRRRVRDRGRPRQQRGHRPVRSLPRHHGRGLEEGPGRQPVGGHPRVPYLRQADGGARPGRHIVNTASAAAYLPSRTLPAYSTSKAAVLMLSECLRAELASKSIGVSAICPGIVNTNITATSRFAGVDEAEEKRRQERSSRLYGMRNFPPEKVADAILRAVVHNEAVVPVTPESKGALWMSRYAPRALRRLARMEPKL